MFEKTIQLNPAEPNKPLDPIWSMRDSAGHMVFVGIPEVMVSAVLMLVPCQAETPFVLPISMGTRPSITVENGALTAVGQGDYYVYGFDSAMRIYGLGHGKLHITDAPTLVAMAGVTPVGNHRVAIYSEETDSYYLITAEINEDGSPTVKLTPA